MTEQLPISIYVCDELSKEFVKINSITNKLAAQFNFQAMTANWYGDEECILFIKLRLETFQAFVHKKQKQQAQPEQEFKMHSDDVFSFVDGQDSHQLIFTIALTEYEQQLLFQQTKLLRGLLQVKLQKVLNIVANQFNLKPI